MEFSSDYPGPSRDDYANVLALNAAFLNRYHDLKGPQKGRLAAAPFLLFSLRENDLDWWAAALADHTQLQLSESSPNNSDHDRGLQSASISFLWQLARRNPYAARIISGAGIAWCEILTGLPLVTVLERVGTRGDLIASRLDGPDTVCSQLLDQGASSHQNIRCSSHFVALQFLLTKSRGDRHDRLPAAACSMTTPRQKIDRRTANRVCEKKV